MSHACRAALAALLVLGPAAVVAQERPVPPAPAAPTPSGPAIADGSSVQLEYTLTDEGGAILDSNRGRDPLRYTHGAHQIVPGLERELAGLHAGDEKKVVVKPEDGYGAVNPASQAEVPKSAIPPDALVVGGRLLARNAAGQGRPVVIKEIRAETVVLDLNHPLAGKTLFFEVKVLDVSAPAAGAPGTDAPAAKPEK